MWRAPFLAVIIVLAVVPARAADRQGMRLWNLTLHTIVSLQMSPAGQRDWGRDQCENDRDHEVDHDERLRIIGIEPGRYDLRVKDKNGRICIVKDVDVKDGAIFTIEEKDLSDCGG
jgi:hypothetical protein